MPSTGATQSFAELDAGANRLSRVLRAAGIQPGDHVAICMENNLRYLEVLWGCYYAGALYTACSSRLTGAELAYIVDDCDAKVFITSAARAEVAAAIVAGTRKVTLRLMIDGVIPGYERYEDALEASSPEPLPGRVAGADMLYSSGTTGKPKGVVGEHRAVPVEDHAMRIERACRKLLGIGPDDVYLCPAPLYHAAPLRYSMGIQAIGAGIAVMEHFDAEECLAAIERHRVTIAQMVPTMFVRLLKLPADVRARYDLSSLRTLIHAAAPCPAPIKRQMIDWLGPILYEYYGGTEGNGFVACDSAEWLAHPGTVGKGIGCTVHICDDTGAELPAGQTGLVYFEGGQSFEYHKDPDKTKSAVNDRGWSTLGDIGHLDDDGYLYLTDRAAYMIISGGVNIYPQDAENVLVTHPDVVDVAVFGIPHDEFGEEVKAVVQPSRMPADEDGAKRLEADLIAYCRAHLASLKCPRSVDFRGELPRDPTGKLFKRLLRDEYVQRAAE